MKSQFFVIMQQVGRSFMLPIALLPAAGLLLGIGGALSNPNTIIAYPVLDVAVMQGIFTVMTKTGVVVFANLPLLFAIGVAIGFAKQERGTAALAAAIGFLVMHQTINAVLGLQGNLVTEGLASVGQGSVLGIQTLEMGVFGGIIAGFITAALHNKFYDVELPQALAFFGGTRFVPIVVSFTFLFVGYIATIVWPFVQTGIEGLGSLVLSSGLAGTFLYGFIERSLIPFGLHHVFYLPFWQTAVGGTLEVGGHVYVGTQNIFFAQLADHGTGPFYEGTSRFMAGKMPFMIFGLPAAALAMYHTSMLKHRKVVGGILFSAALTAFITGITEPIEFLFLFVAPLLYVVHALFAGLSFMLMDYFNVTVGQTFSGGIIDLTLFGILQGQDRTNWMMIPVVGVFYSVIYYFGFRFIIMKFDLATPGRRDEVVDAADVSSSGSETEKVADSVIDALGGLSNLKNVDACITRLRITVVSAANIDMDKLKAVSGGKHHIIGNGIQIVYGTRSDNIKNRINVILGSK